MKDLIARIFRGFLLINCKIVTGVQARWQHQPIDTDHRVSVYYANHSSHLDGIVIWSCLPKSWQKQVHPIAAKDYWSKTTLRKFIAIHVFNAVLINRKPTCQDNPLLILEQAIANKQSLILFPEGSRGDGCHIADFKGGLYHLAKKCPHVQFIPVYLNNFNRVLPKGSKLVVPIICSVVFGKAIEPLAIDENKVDFLTRAKQSLETLAS